MCGFALPAHEFHPLSDHLVLKLKLVSFYLFILVFFNLLTDEKNMKNDGKKTVLS